MPKDVKSWMKDTEKLHFVTLQELDSLLGEYLDSMDVMRDIECIIQSRHPHYKRFMSPLSLNESMKTLVSIQLRSGNWFSFSYM